MTFLHKQFAKHLLDLWKSTSKEKIFRLFPAWFLYVLKSTYECLQPQGLSIQFWWVTKSKGNSLHCFGGSRSPWQTAHRKVPSTGFSLTNLWLMEATLSTSAGYLHQVLFKNNYIFLIGFKKNGRFPNGFSMCPSFWVNFSPISFSPHPWLNLFTPPRYSCPSTSLSRMTYNFSLEVLKTIFYFFIAFFLPMCVSVSETCVTVCACFSVWVWAGTCHGTPEVRGQPQVDPHVPAGLRQGLGTHCCVH